jgi:hypothetical protein
VIYKNEKGQIEGAKYENLAVVQFGWWFWFEVS